MPRLFSSQFCFSWTEKPVTKPKASEIFKCLALVSCWASGHLQRLFFLLNIPQQSIRQQTPRETVLPQGWVVSFTPSFGLHGSRQKASFSLQLDKYWAPQMNFESAEHPQILQNQWGLQTVLKNKLLPAHKNMFRIFACSYFCISPSLLHYLEMPSIVTTFPPPLFFSPNSTLLFHKMPFLLALRPMLSLTVSIFLSKSRTYFYLSLCLSN